jgi:hypothetical protein
MVFRRFKKGKKYTSVATEKILFKKLNIYQIINPKSKTVNLIKWIIKNMNC